MNPSPAEVVSRECPVCAGTVVSRLFTQQFEQIDGGSLISGYDVVVCRECGCGFADGIPSQAAFDAYYRDLSKYEHEESGGRSSPEDDARFRSTADRVGRVIPSKDARVLEIGSGTGGLLAALRSRGFSRLTGLDPSSRCREMARELHGIEVMVGSIDGLSKTDQTFDFIILIAVLEHLRDVRASLALLRKILTPEGRLFVDVPDVAGFRRHIDAPFQQFSTEHVNFFSETSLRNVLVASGYRVDAVGHEISHHSSCSEMPGLYCLAEVGGRPEAPVLEHDHLTEEALETYIEASEGREKRLRTLMGILADTQQPVLVWGVGTLGRRLLATTRLAEVNIAAFVDSNPRYQGKSIEGKPILSPGQAAARAETILICSWVFGNEIEHQIREQLRCRNQILRLDQD